MQDTQEKLDALAKAEKASAVWSPYERMLMKYLRGEILRGDEASAREFFKDLYGVVCKKRAALVELEAELFTCKKSNKEAKK